MLICQITDTHIKAGGKPAYGRVDTAAMLRRCIDHVARRTPRPDVVLLTGDLVDFGRADEYQFLRELLDSLPIPYYLLPGNHDDRQQLREAFPDHAYLRQWAPFVQYAIDDWALRLIALDTVIPGEGGGRLCDERLAWLDRQLAGAPQRPTLIAMHHPPFRTFIAHMDEIGLDGYRQFAGVLARHPQVERIVCGHLHRPIEARVAGIVASTCPSPAHQVALDLAPDAPARFMMEPPGYQLHCWSAETGVVSHTSLIGDFAGPYPFFEADGSLVD
jgi:Icc protein